MKNNQKSFLAYGIFIWVLCILFFFDEFFLRVFLGTIATNIIQDFQLNLEQFALMVSGYYLTYSLMQLPVGIIIDRTGVKLPLTFASAICGIGIIQFTFSHSFYLGLFGRLVIGFGSSFAFISLLKIALNWFPQKHFGFLSATAQFSGGIGPILAGAPLALVVRQVNGNWRYILFIIGLFTLFLSLLIGIFLKDKPKGQKTKPIFIETREKLSRRLLRLLKNNQVWWISLCAGFGYVSVPLIGAFWGTTYLEIRGFSKTLASSICSTIWIGYSIGCILIGKFSDQIKRRKLPLLVWTFLGFIASSAILFSPFSHPLFLSILFILTGIAGSAQAITFPIITEQVPQNLHGTGMGFNNSVMTGMAMIIPPLASSIIQSAIRSSPSESSTYVLAAFTKGLAMIPILFLTSFLLAFFCVKETFCRSQKEVHKISFD